MDHKHIWKYSKRKHGRAGRVFVECTVPGCGIVRQATNAYGLRVFHTGTPKGGRSRVVSYRLKKWQEEILADRGQTFVEFVDEAFSASQTD